MIKILLVSLSLGSLLLLSGCATIVAAGAGAGAIAYVNGDSETVVDSTLDSVYASTLSVIEEMELKLIDESKDKTGAAITARDFEDTKISIKLSSVSPEVTEISVRYGIFGNEAKSTQLLRRIVE